MSISSKRNSSGALVDDFAHCELSLIALASEDEISQAGVDVEGLILKDIVSPLADNLKLYLTETRTFLLDCCPLGSCHPCRPRCHQTL